MILRKSIQYVDVHHKSCVTFFIADQSVKGSSSIIGDEEPCTAAFIFSSGSDSALRGDICTTNNAVVESETPYRRMASDI